MCSPALVIAGVAAGMAATQSTMEVVQANKMAEATAESTNKALTFDYQLLNEKQLQINEQASQDAFERQRQGLKDRAKVMVATGEAGVGGNSAIRSLYNTMFQTGYDLGSIETNRGNALSQVEAEKKGSFAQAESRINQAKAMSYSPFMAMLKIGSSAVGAGLSGYGSGKQLFPGGGGGTPSALQYQIPNQAQTDVYGQIYRH